MTQNETAVSTSKPRAFAAPPVDVFESKEAFKLVAELPGVSLDEVALTLEQDVLTMQASRGDQPLDYRRQFTLKVPVDRDAVEAELKEGVLTLTLPKAASAKPRTIQVKAQ